MADFSQLGHVQADTGKKFFYPEVFLPGYNAEYQMAGCPCGLLYLGGGRLDLEVFCFLPLLWLWKHEEGPLLSKSSW